MIPALCDDRNDKGAYLRRRNCHPHAIQFQRKRQGQQKHERTDRLGVDRKIGQGGLFRCVKIRGRDADKRQKQHGSKEKRQIPSDTGVCACGCAEQQPYFRAGQKDHRCADCRNDKRCKVSGAPCLPDVRIFALAVVKIVAHAAPAIPHGSTHTKA